MFCFASPASLRSFHRKKNHLELCMEMRAYVEIVTMYKYFVILTAVISLPG